MMMTTRGKYAIAAIVQLAKLASEADEITTKVKIADIISGSEFSIPYVEQLFAKLVEHGILVSQRGPKGGYSLARMPDSVTLLDIINAAGENIDMNKGEHSRVKKPGEFDLYHSASIILEQFGVSIRDFFASITLKDALARLDAVNADASSQDPTQGTVKGA